MHTEVITLNMKDKINGIRMQNEHYTASHAFSSLYIWKEDMGLSLYLKDSLFAVKCQLQGENSWFFPCGNPLAVCRCIEKLLPKNNPSFCYMREEDAELLEQKFSGVFSITESLKDNEYLYDRTEQQTLKGRKFSSLRNHINRVTTDHDLYVENLNESNLSEAIAINNAWQLQSNHLDQEIQDTSAAELLLNQWSMLEVHGVIVFVDGQPCAVVAGYPLSVDTFDIALSKQTERIPGLSVYAKNALVKSLPPYFKHLNAEEDLGIEGLRIMKQQMKPTGHIRMFDGSLKFKTSTI